MLTTRATVACRYYEHAKPRRNIQATRMPRYNDNGSIALPMRCPGVSRDDKSSWKPDRFERAVARKHEAPIFPTASNQTSHVLRSAWFRARFSYSYWSPRCLTLFLVAPPRFLTDTSWGNDKSSRCTDGPQFGEHFYLTAGRTFRSRRYVHGKFYVRLNYVSRWRDKRFFRSQETKDPNFLRLNMFEASNLLNFIYNFCNCNA